MGTGNPFFSWLATQPAFIEVGMGILFCLLIAPVLLAMIAVGLTSLGGETRAHPFAKRLAACGYGTGTAGQQVGASATRSRRRSWPGCARRSPSVTLG